MLDWFHRFDSVGDILKHTLIVLLTAALLFPFWYAAIFFATYHSFFLVFILGGISLEIIVMYFYGLITFFIDAKKRRALKNMPQDKKMLYYLGDRIDY